ncbi:MAG: TlpA family protein disulfide reductase [Chitinophagales bacterium]|jgi:cytochrome c biogenesis protein CcmG/thiol:disulfide interchange protein DsbE|nr:TlpA family protein disulfide reductase [Sphingobacteriales bacterium]
MKKLVATILLFNLAFTSGLLAGGEEGKDLPTAMVEDLTGQKVDFKSMLKPGKFYVITFWATWCVPCKKELSNMVDLAPKWKDKLNTEIIAVSTDDSRAKSKVKTYVTGEDWPFTVLLDMNQDLMRSLGIQQIPFTLIVNGEGKIVYTHNSYVEGDEFEIENKLSTMVK